MSVTVSIIVPLYNRANFIEATLKSVQVQTYAQWEVIVVDDGSTDKSFALACEMAQQDHRIRVIKRQRQPKGGSTCRNIGASMAIGKYLIFLDSDDLLAPFCLERRLAVYEKHQDQDFLVFPMLLFNEEPYDLNTLWNVGTDEDDLVRFLRVEAVWQTTCPIYKRDSFVEKGGFDESLSFWQDYELHTRLLIEGGLRYQKLYHMEPDCFNRRHEQASISQSGLQGEEKLYQKINIYGRLVKLLQNKEKLTPKNKRATGTAYFSFSLKWVTEHQNLKQALQIWQQCYKINLITSINFVAGYCALISKYLQMKLHPVSFIFALLYKSIFFLFLMKYKYQEPKR